MRDCFLDEKGVIMVRRAEMVLRLYMSYMDSGQWPYISTAYQTWIGGVKEWSWFFCKRWKMAEMDMSSIQIRDKVLKESMNTWKTTKMELDERIMTRRASKSTQ